MANKSCGPSTRILLAASIGLAAMAAERVPIVVSPKASAVERLAAGELAHYLGRLYPDERFDVTESAPAQSRAIVVGTRLVLNEQATGPESFLVTHSGQRGIVSGEDPRGTLYGVYSLLEKLGFGFYLSYETAPPPRKGRLNFEAWDLADAPVFRDRVVFNWHNFLSSGSTWELEDWQKWIAQAAKMRFNTIMVHAYGNNPMFTFRHNGQTKPVGYLATTAQGRDWGTQHVNDVRRLFGGEVFKAPVLGASIAQVPEDQRADAARGLMQKVFAYARGRGLRVTFALDADTESSNPQEVIATLPESARITSGKHQLANPDTPEGFEYYKAQVRQLFETYPEIDRLAVWFRNNRTPWRDLAPAQFPAAWKADYEAALGRNPRLREDKEAHGMFVMGKLVRAFGRALAETGHSNVELASGSWRLYFLPAADQFFPREATLLPLDWETVFETEAARTQFRSVASGRKLAPIVWAHHDDRTYVGRPYTPYRDFAAQLAGRGASGFGIIHWTTRPLDLYFKSLGDQVWKATENQSLEAACREMAARSFGESNREAGGSYLLRWVTEAPMFGRETGNQFIDAPLQEPESVAAKARERLALLSKIGGRNDRLDYFRDFEEFVAAFHRAQAAVERARALIKTGELEAARGLLAPIAAEDIIRQYARMSSRGGISRGEQALVVSLNLRWLPYVVSLRQALGMEAVRLKFGPTRHEPLAQGAGSNTFHFDAQRRLWKVLGEKETGAPAAETREASELCRTGIRIDKPLALSLAPITGEPLAPGRYTAELLFAPAGTVDIEIEGARFRTDNARFTAPVETARGGVRIVIRPVRGPVIACSAALTPSR